MATPTFLTTFFAFYCSGRLVTEGAAFRVSTTDSEGEDSESSSENCPDSENLCDEERITDSQIMKNMSTAVMRT